MSGSFCRINLADITYPSKEYNFEPFFLAFVCGGQYFLVQDVIASSLSFMCSQRLVLIYWRRLTVLIPNQNGGIQGQNRRKERSLAYRGLSASGHTPLHNSQSFLRKLTHWVRSFEEDPSSMPQLRQ